MIQKMLIRGELSEKVFNLYYYSFFSRLYWLGRVLLLAGLSEIFLSG